MDHEYDKEEEQYEDIVNLAMRTLARTFSEELATLITRIRESSKQIQNIKRNESIYVENIEQYEKQIADAQTPHNAVYAAKVNLIQNKWSLNYCRRFLAMYSTDRMEAYFEIVAKMKTTHDI